MKKPFVLDKHPIKLGKGTYYLVSDDLIPGTGDNGVCQGCVFANSRGMATKKCDDLGGIDHCTDIDTKYDEYYDDERFEHATGFVFKQALSDILKNL